MMVTTARLQRMRADARIERDSLLERSSRLGEDPASSVAEMPSVDEFVVHALRDELLEKRGRLAEFGLARLAAHGPGRDAADHRRDADRVEFELLREIAADVPQLTVAVWAVASRLEVHE